MKYDFFVEKYGKPSLQKWQQYVIIKCTKHENLKQYEKSIMNYYKRKQIDLNWGYIKLFLPKFIPYNSILLKIIFSLSKPFISIDDDNFYPKDNPICKEKVFKIPMMRASSWKGALRYAAMRYALEGKDNEKIKRRLTILRLFGTEKDKIEDFLNEKFKEKLREKSEFSKMSEKLVQFIDFRSKIFQVY